MAKTKAGPAKKGGGGKSKGQGKGGKSKAKGGRKGRGKKKKKKLKCGESGSYGELQKKDAQSVGMERDHVPSAGALRTRALDPSICGGEGLCKRQERAIARLASACAIPKGIHADYSRTFRGLNTPAQMSKDAGNLKEAARKDTDRILKGLKPPKVSKQCRKKYLAWARKVKKRSKSWYDKKIKEAVKK